MSTPELRELSDIREYVLNNLPEGFNLESVDLTFGTLFDGQEPAFKVMISITEEPGAIAYGVGKNISQRIRQRWSRDDLYIDIRFRELLDDETMS